MRLLLTLLSLVFLAACGSDAVPADTPAEPDAATLTTPSPVEPSQPTVTTPSPEPVVTPTAAPSESDVTAQEVIDRVAAALPDDWEAGVTTPEIGGPVVSNCEDPFPPYGDDDAHLADFVKQDIVSPGRAVVLVKTHDSPMASAQAKRAFIEATGNDAFINCLQTTIEAEAEGQAGTVVAVSPHPTGFRILIDGSGSDRAADLWLLSFVAGPHHTVVSINTLGDPVDEGLLERIRALGSDN